MVTEANETTVKLRRRWHSASSPWRMSGTHFDRSVSSGARMYTRLLCMCVHVTSMVHTCKSATKAQGLRGQGVFETTPCRACGPKTFRCPRYNQVQYDTTQRELLYSFCKFSTIGRETPGSPRNRCWNSFSSK